MLCSLANVLMTASPTRRAAGPPLTLTSTIAAGLMLTLALTAQAGQAEPAVADLAWLAGCWVGEHDGARSEECWTPPAGDIMLGLHRDLAADGTLRGFELLRIVADDQGVAYLASPQGRAATTFRLLELDQTEVVFANPEHDFPQRIIYTLRTGLLQARVEGVIQGEQRSMQWTWRPALLADLANEGSASDAGASGGQP